MREDGDRAGERGMGDDSPATHEARARAREVNRERVSPRPATGDDLYDIAGALASANVRG